MAASTAGLEEFASMIADGLNAPYIAVGTAQGEVFRKAVGAVIPSGNIIRLRATLSLTEGNGSHTYLALFKDATGQAYSGILLGDDAQAFNKTQTQVLNIECRVTLQQGVAA